MRKKIFPLFLLAVVCMSIGIVSVAYGADGGSTGTNPPPLIQDKDDIIAIAEGIATWVYRLFFVIAVLYILFAAFTYLTAKDDASAVKKAQASLKHAVIAIIIALISTGLALLIKNFITS